MKGVASALFHTGPRCKPCAGAPWMLASRRCSAAACTAPPAAHTRLLLRTAARWPAAAAHSAAAQGAAAQGACMGVARTFLRSHCCHCSCGSRCCALRARCGPATAPANAQATAVRRCLPASPAAPAAAAAAAGCCCSCPRPRCRLSSLRHGKGASGAPPALGGRLVAQARAFCLQLQAGACVRTRALAGTAITAVGGDEWRGYGLNATPHASHTRGRPTQDGRKGNAWPSFEVQL
jgi:hypothetical protein